MLIKLPSLFQTRIQNLDHQKACMAAAAITPKISKTQMSRRVFEVGLSNNTICSMSRSILNKLLRSRLQNMHDVLPPTIKKSAVTIQSTTISNIWAISDVPLKLLYHHENVNNLPNSSFIWKQSSLHCMRDISCVLVKLVIKLILSSEFLFRHVPVK